MVALKYDMIWWRVNVFKHLPEVPTKGLPLTFWLVSAVKAHILCIRSLISQAFLPVMLYSAWNAGFLICIVRLFYRLKPTKRQSSRANISDLIYSCMFTFVFARIRAKQAYWTERSLDSKKTVAKKSCTVFKGRLYCKKLQCMLWCYLCKENAGVSDKKVKKKIK